MNAERNIVILALTLLLCSSVSTGTLNHLGPDQCLVHRIDVIPCSRYNQKTSLPKRDEYGIYSTKYVSTSRRQVTCKLRRDGHSIRNIQKIGDSMVIFSPGFKLNQTYGNQMLVDFNIQCGQGKVAYLNITKLDLEEKSCADPRHNNENVCVDYLRVQRKNSGASEACGNDTSPVKNLLEQDSFRLIFRTSWNNRYSGFEGIVVCFDPDETDHPGCTTGGARKKRQILERLDTFASLAVDRARESSDQLELILQGPLPRRFRLSAEEERDLSAITKSLLSQARESEKDRLSEEFLNPPAIIYNEDDKDVDPVLPTIGTPFSIPTFLPTLKKPSISPPTEIILPGRPPKLTLRRQRRRASFLSTETAKLALKHENDCNPILKASSRAVIHKLETDNPSRLQSLRKSYSTDEE